VGVFLFVEMLSVIQDAHSKVAEVRLVIESRYWREDLANYARAFRPLKKPPSWSERLAVNFEKDVTLSLFMVRRLAEAGKFSSRMSKHKVELYRSKFVGEHHRLRFGDVGELYRIDDEKKILKGVPFVCNQFIHADFTYAIQGSDRNWAGLFTSSDFEKRKWLYRVPLTEIVKVLELAVSDYPSAIFTRYDREKEDWIVETD